MLEEIYAMLGYEDIFTIKAKEVKEFAIGKAHNHLMSILLRCRELGIVTNVNEDVIDKIENEYWLRGISRRENIWSCQK